MIKSASESSSSARRPGFTLIELLVVVAIIAILVAIGLVNFQEAMRRARTADCAANLKAIGHGLALYRLDMGAYPVADGMAGKAESPNQTLYGEGPAGNGYWSAIPNSLVRLGYVSDRDHLFCPALSSSHPDRREHLRYAYNAAALDSGGMAGGDGQLDGVGATGERTWVCRCLHVNSRAFDPDRYIVFPHGEPPNRRYNTWGQENVLWNDFSVGLEYGQKP